MSASEGTIEFLTKVPLFRGLKKRQLEHLAKRFVPREYNAGQAIVTQGTGGEGFFIVISGKAEAIREYADGGRVVINTFGPTDFFGAVSLLDEGPRTASVFAAEDCECLVLTRSDFLAVMKNDAEMGVAVSRELAKRIRRALSSL